MKVSKWLSANTTSLRGKRIIITGATGGIGKEALHHLARLGADITICARDLTSANKLREEVISSNKTSVDIIPLDLKNMSSVKTAINHIKQYDGIDVLIMNAGVYNVPLEKLDNGYNNVFQTNFIAPYYIIKELMPELKKCENSICVAVSSIAHNYSTIDNHDVDFSQVKKPSKIYGNSKRFLTFALYELFKHSDINLSIVHPGITLTKMTNHYPKAINWLVKIGIKLLFPSPKEASLNLIKGVFSPTSYHEWIGPRFFNIWGKPKKTKLKTCTKDESENIFKIAEDIYEKISR